MLTSGGSRRKSDRGSTLQFWAWWVWWTWLAWKFDLCNDVVKQNPLISIFRKLGSLKSDRGSSPLCPPLDPPLLTVRSNYARMVATWLLREIFGNQKIVGNQKICRKRTKCCIQFFNTHHIIPDLQELISDI